MPTVIVGVPLSTTSPPVGVPAALRLPAPSLSAGVVVSMAVLRMLGGSTILENNIVQTGASAGSSIASGVIFTIPALVILGYWDDFRYSWVLAIAGLGGILGVFFSVPLRRSPCNMMSNFDPGAAFSTGTQAKNRLSPTRWP
mgnify:CR=1 FL=1